MREDRRMVRWRRPIACVMAAAAAALAVAAVVVELIAAARGAPQRR